jgi:hypothetical protein
MSRCIHTLNANATTCGHRILSAVFGVAIPQGFDLRTRPQVLHVSGVGDHEELRRSAFFVPAGSAGRKHGGNGWFPVVIHESKRADLRIDRDLPGKNGLARGL